MHILEKYKLFTDRIKWCWQGKFYYYEHGHFIGFLTDNKNIGYLSNSKVACTSIKSGLLRGSDKPHKDFLERTVRKVENLEDYFVFTFVRNPFS